MIGRSPAAASCLSVGGPSRTQTHSRRDSANLLQEPAPAVTEASTSPGLVCVCRVRAGAVVRPSLRLGGADGVTPSPSPKARGQRLRRSDVRGQEKTDVLARTESAPWLHLRLSFCSGSQWVGGGPWLWGAVISRAPEPNARLFQTHPEVMFCQPAGHPSAQSRWHKGLTLPHGTLLNRVF